MPFQNPLTLTALLSIIPLIIIYILRPKPTVLSIPSLMFVLKLNKKQKQVYTSLTKIIHNPLFLIQLLILILLSIKTANYYYTSKKPLNGKHTILILNTSTNIQINSRFKNTIQITNNYINKKNNIILTSNIPQLTLKNKSTSATKNIFNKVKPKTNTTNLSTTITTNIHLLSKKKNRIIIISNFTN